SPRRFSGKSSSQIVPRSPNSLTGGSVSSDIVSGSPLRHCAITRVEIQSIPISLPQTLGGKVPSRKRVKSGHVCPYGNTKGGDVSRALRKGLAGAREHLTT